MTRHLGCKDAAVVAGCLLVISGCTGGAVRSAVIDAQNLRMTYLYNAQEKTFITYNDAETEISRAKYIKKHHLQGLMFWQYTGDPNNTLLNAMDKGFDW